METHLNPPAGPAPVLPVSNPSLGIPRPLTPDATLPYEKQLDRDARWALKEGSRHFEEKSAVFEALRKISRKLEQLSIPYAIVGGMALFRHGVRRFTEDVDILVTRESLTKIHDALTGLGYVPPHRHSKNLRDAEFGVRIEFLTTGDYPGDGKAKPVSFPDPALVNFESDGIRYIELNKLIELKLASGMTNPGRLRDLADVLELIKGLNLPDSFAETLDPYVRDQYLSLSQQARKRYVAVWKTDQLADPTFADTLSAMQQDGVVVESLDSDDSVRLVTADPSIAAKYDMVDESEYWTGQDPS